MVFYELLTGTCQYHFTQVTITSSSDLRFWNKGGRHNFTSSPYQIPKRNTSG